MKKLAIKIGGLGCLIVAVWLYHHGYTNGWVIALGILGAIDAL